MKVAVQQDDDLFYHTIQLTQDEMRTLIFGEEIDQEFQYDIIGKKDLKIKIIRETKEEEE